MFHVFPFRWIYWSSDSYCLPANLTSPGPRLWVSRVFRVNALGTHNGGRLERERPRQGFNCRCFGVLIATIGSDPKSGVERFAFDSAYLWTGVNLIIVALGMFGVPEVIALATQKSSIAQDQELGEGFMQGIRDTLDNWWLVIRSAIIGAWVGFLPGLGSSVADWFAYANAAQTEKNTENFGKGDIRGVIAPEASNNAKEAGSYIPTLAFGIPGGTSTALILVAFITVGIKPGPAMLTTQLNLTFAVIWTLVLSNVLAVALCMLLTKPLAKACFLPFNTIVPLVAVFVFIGAFAANNSAYDLVTLFIFSLLGFMMRRHGWPRPPLLLGVVLGNKMERYLWLSYARFGLEWLFRPAVMILFALVFATFILPYIKERRERKQKAAAAVKPV